MQVFFLFLDFGANFFGVTDNAAFLPAASDPLLTQNPKKTGRAGRKHWKIRQANGGKKHKSEPKWLRFVLETAYYLVPPDQVAYIETRRGGGDAQYGLFLGLSSGKELGVWYRTEEARKAAYTKLARQVEIGKRQDREDILYRLRVIEACINKTDKRTLRIWKQLQQLLHLESEETE